MAEPLNAYPLHSRFPIWMTVIAVMATAIMFLLGPSLAQNILVAVALLIPSAFALILRFNSRIEFHEDKICMVNPFLKRRKEIYYRDIGGIFEDHFMMWEYEWCHWFYLIPRDLLSYPRGLIPASFRDRTFHLGPDSGNYKGLLREVIQRTPSGIQISPYVQWLLQEPDRKRTRREIIEFYKRTEPGQLLH